MQRSTLLIGLIGASVFAGCRNNDLDAPPLPTTTTLVYSPSLGDVPVPNDVLFKDTVDATLNFPAASDPAQQPLFDALNSLDGWSTTAPLSFHFDAEIDPLTVTAGTTVRVFEVTAAVNPATGLDIGTPVTGVVTELTSPANYVVAPAASDPLGATFAIVPTQPLKPATHYMVIVTNGVTDALGDAVTYSSEYGLAKVSIATNPYPADHPLVGLQLLVNAMEGVAGAAGIPPADIVTSFSFTTQDTTTVLGTARTVALGGEAAVLAAIGAAFPGHPAGTDAPVNTVPSATVNTTSIAPSLGGQGDLYIGGLTLPYYLTAAANPTGILVTDTDPLTEYWHARYTFPFGIDTEANVSRYNPLPVESGAETVPLLISMPDETATGLTEPAAGWPVVIFQHGITSNRTSVLGIADALNAAGFAVIAMDLPLHGISDLAHDPFAGALFTGFTESAVRERTFGLDDIDNTTSAPGADGVADTSGAHFINLTSLRTQRDNLRQAAADLFGLKKAISDGLDVDGAGVAVDLDPANVHFIGMSLGSIVGTSFCALEPSVLTATLNVPGAGIPRFLEASPAFGPIVIGGLAAAGVVQGTPEFDQFMWAAQTSIDSGDPLNYLTALTATGTPLFVQEVVGDGTVDDLFGLTDQVIPNAVAAAPLSGTEPMIALLGMTSVTGAGLTVTANGAARFTQGAHSSLLDPTPDVDGDGVDEVDTSLANATAEMQGQIISWLLSGGAQVNVADATVVQ